MSSADLDVSTSVLSVSSSIESESHVTAENGVLGATALVTTEANMIPLSTIFVPYVTAEVDASVATSLAISEAISLKIGDDQSATLGSTGDYVSARSAADLESNVSETISIAQKTVLPSITLASLFPIRITNHFPSTESTVSQNGWSASPDAPFEAQSKPPTDSSLPYGCYAASVNVTGLLPPTKLASSSDEDTLSHIWRPIECDIRSIQPSVVTMPFHLIAPLHGKAETQPTSCVLAENAPSNESLEVSQLLSNANAIDRVSSVRDSPRFPSPVSGSFSPAHRPHHPASASATPPPPASQELKSAFVSFATDSVIEQGSSGSGTFVPNEDLNPVSNLLPSSSSSSVGSEPIVFHPHLYSDSNRPIPVQFIMCDSHTGCPQFLSPMWNCTTTLESLPPYSTSMCLSPSTSSHQSVADSCSNFSVGYLIGQPTSCGPIASEDHVTSSAICSTSSSADSNTVYFGFDPSGSS
ncbi:unnamed protein product [Dicrocoelium dendriticum]|nr:unnamed protein product [Dicrocoelium dendriticum]